MAQADLLPSSVTLDWKPAQGWARKDTTLPDTFSIEQASVDGTCFVLQFGQVGQPSVTLQVVGCVDDGLDPQRPPVFEVLLDPGVLEERVDGDIGIPADNRCLRGPVVLNRTTPMAGAVEDQLHRVGPSDIKVVSNERFEERPGASGRTSNTIVRDASTCISSSTNGARDPISIG
ncbi:MAG: hypothetical protein R2722_07105 [Tessaracoccus sp.]